MLYIHIPFCDSKCYYCSFNSYTNLHNLKDIYVDALCKEIKYKLLEFKYKNLKTIFIGGGTPSTLNDKHYEKIFNILNPYITHNTEITCEANPNSVDIQWIRSLYNFKVNRISFGVQSFDNKKLEFLGRNHTSATAFKAIENAKKVGFEHINCDIIYDTSIDTIKLLNNDIDIIDSLGIDHLSAYGLVIEKKTDFYNKKNIKVENEDITKFLFQRIKKSGFKQYEISNFSKNKKSRSRHNVGYWKHKNYLGVGSGAVSCKNKKRIYNSNNVNSYIKNPLHCNNIEKLSEKDIKLEKIMLGLRSKIGIEKKLLNIDELKRAYELTENKKLKNKKNRFFTKNFLISDALALYILD